MVKKAWNELSAIGNPPVENVRAHQKQAGQAPDGACRVSPIQSAEAPTRALVPFDPNVVVMHDLTPTAQWNKNRVVYVEENGEQFITYPHVLVWRTGPGRPRWAAPFGEFERAFPKKAQELTRGYVKQPQFHVNKEDIEERYVEARNVRP